LPPTSNVSISPTRRSIPQLDDSLTSEFSSNGRFVAVYHDDDFQDSFRAELAKGVTELGFDPADYGLADSPTDGPAYRSRAALD